MGDGSDVTCDGGSSNASSHGYSGNAVSWSAGSTTPRAFSGLSSSPASSCSSGDFEIGSYHCPFCGGTASESKRATLFAVVSDAEAKRLNALIGEIKTLDD